MATHPAAFDKQRDAASYDDYAQTYETYINRLSEPLARRICQLARLEPGARVLDVGTGSGIAARHAARLAGPTGSVLGVDLSQGMIASARRSVEDWQGSAPDFRVMDVEALELPDRTFDAVICLCAVRHFPDIARALGEMRRVLKPGGRIVVSFGYARPIAAFPLALHLARRAAAVALNPVRPRLIGPTALTRLARRLLPPATQVVYTEWGESDPRGELVRRVRQAGFADVETDWTGHEEIFTSAQEFWELQSTLVTVVRKRLEASSPHQVDRLKRMFIEGAERVLARQGKLIYPFGAFFVAGTLTER